MNSKSKSRSTKLIEKSDIEAERLISIIRMTLASMLFFGVATILYQSKSVGLETRQFELYGLLTGAVCYFVLGAFNFYCATEARLKPWMTWVFNLGEIAIVSAQLYIDVADSNTSSLLTFASPVLMIVALVICVQVLRYQILLHVYSSLLLVGLCVLVMFHKPQIGNPLSAQAANELQLLYTVPPNIMRLIMLSTMALLVGIAVYRSRKLIETVARDTEIAVNRNRFLPSGLSEVMTDENLESLRSGEERELAVMFVDIRGFTQFSEEAGPRETALFLTHYRSLITDAVSANDGVVDKFIGDGVLIIHGLHSDIKQACSDSMETAQSIKLEIEAWNEQRKNKSLDLVNIAIGIHAGPAIIGAIGDDRRLEFTAIGNTVNLASRLENIAKMHNWTLAVFANAAAMADVNVNDFISTGPIVLKGSSEPMEVLGKV